MIQIRFIPQTGPELARLRAGGPDAYGQPAEHHTATSGDLPCRCCLPRIPAGCDYLIAAWRPFATLHPYAETGPVFFCAESCTPADESDQLPAILNSPTQILRGYDAAGRIVYGTGAVVPRDSIPDRARALFTDPAIAWVDVRSAANNCFLCRILRSPA